MSGGSAPGAGSGTMSGGGVPGAGSGAMSGGSALGAGSGAMSGSSAPGARGGAMSGGSASGSGSGTTSGGGASGAAGGATVGSAASGATGGATSRSSAAGVSGAVAGGGAYGIQLGAFSTEVGASNQWRTLVGRFGDQLQGLHEHVVAADTPSGRVYRLQAMVGDEARARAICDSLRKRSQGCVAVLPH
jgi:hypothetical protein